MFPMGSHSKDWHFVVLLDSCSEDLDKWIESNRIEVPDELKTLAVSVVEWILGPKSELVEMCDDADEARLGRIWLLTSKAEFRGNNSLRQSRDW